MKRNLALIQRDKRYGQKGAALVSVLLISLLLLVVSGAIIMITGLSRATTVDAVAERQAYEAAATGMQTVLNTLRGNGPGLDISFKDAAVRYTSNKPDDWMVEPRLSNWLNYTYPAAQPDRVPLTSPYDPFNGMAFSVTISAPDRPAGVVVPTPNPTWIDGPVVRPSPEVKPAKPWWHPWNCGHCSWDYTHCSLYNPPNSGTLRSDGMGCRHKHCIPPANIGEATGEDGYQRLLIRVVGYGPRGARKQIEMLVKRTTILYNPEALIYVQGSDSAVAPTFSISGTPEVKFDSGDNIAFNVTSSADETAISNQIAINDKVTVSGKGDDFEVEDLDNRPEFMKSADNARIAISDLEADAKVRGRWFNSYPAVGNAGTNGKPEITFVQGNASLTTNGVGILVVTGTLTLSGKNKFNGLILVIGDGKIVFPAGGEFIMEGSVLVAKFGATGGFLPAVFELSGGKHELKTNRDEVRKALELLNINVLAVRDS